MANYKFLFCSLFLKYEVSFIALLNSIKKFINRQSINIIICIIKTKKTIIKKEAVMENFNSKEHSKNILNEVCKGCEIAKCSIDDIMKKTEGMDIENELKTEYDNYDSIFTKSVGLMKEMGENPDSMNVIDKAMLWSGIFFNTLIDDSERKIAEVMINGTNMGITSTKEVMIDNPNADERAKAIANEFLEHEQNFVRSLHNFL